VEGVRSVGIVHTGPNIHNRSKNKVFCVKISENIDKKKYIFIAAGELGHATEATGDERVELMGSSTSPSSPSSLSSIS